MTDIDSTQANVRFGMSNSRVGMRRTELSRSEAAFVASMNGLDGFTRQAARELNPHGIRVYAVENAGATIIAKVFELIELEEQ